MAGTIDILTQSRKVFFEYIDICNGEQSYDDLQFYRDIIAEHRKVANLSVLIASDDFLHKIPATLRKWDMNSRRARLVDVSTMCASIRSHQEDFDKLYRFRLEELAEDDIEDLMEQLKKVFCGLKIMASKRRIVGVSKALHFLLPDLVIPIDGSNTLPAFCGYNRYDNIAEKEFKTFADIFMKTIGIAKRLNLTKSDVSGEYWSCSVPKLIDNAIFGFKIKNTLKNK